MAIIDKVIENRTLNALKDGGIALGIQSRSHSPLIAELAGYLGFDYLYIETEHYACNDETIENLVRASEVSGITPWVRVIDDSSENIMHMLDIGAKGVIVPHLETKKQAIRLVESCKFPPIGKRGASPTSRAARFATINSNEYMMEANKSCSSIGMIESIKAVENLDEILDAGIDMIRVGRGDLSLEMGVSNQKDNAFVDTLRYITDTANKRNVPVGTSAIDVEHAKYYKDLGFRCLTVAADIDFIKRELGKLLTNIRDEVL